MFLPILFGSDWTGRTSEEEPAEGGSGNVTSSLADPRPTVITVTSQIQYVLVDILDLNVFKYKNDFKEDLQ